jgi:cytoskeleton protein RodZ
MTEAPGHRNEGAAAPTGAPSGTSAGAQLRRARQAQGLHIAALAAAIKVSPKKLDALENDRYQELPDATFTRALAQTVCRHLKIDAEPVLAQLPSAGQPTRLEHVTRGLNTPFREREAQVDGGSGEPSWWGNPAVLISGALLIAAAAFLWWPSPGTLGDTLAGWQDRIGAWVGGSPRESGVASSAPLGEGLATVLPSDAVAANAGASTATEAPAGTTATAPPPATGEAAVTPVAAPAVAPDELPNGLLVLRARAESWIEVKDAGGAILLSRLVSAGEAVGVDGTPPLRVKVGNAEGTDVFFRGQPFELTAFTRDNVARLELR